jgi:lysophospholipid acyltransferase (LPLAT)-like uncharacterized protein
MVVSPTNYPAGRQIFALCERDAFALAGHIARWKGAVLVDNSRDGDWASALLERIGCRVVRGSSLRGGVKALKGLCDVLTLSEGPAGIVVDGPLGPPGRAKGGVIQCARLTSRPVQALAAEASSRVTIRGSWSKIYIPLPFSRVTIALDEPLPGVEGSGAAAVGDLAAKLSERLSVMRERALAACRSAVKLSISDASASPGARMPFPGGQA